MNAHQLRSEILIRLQRLNQTNEANEISRPTKHGSWKGPLTIAALGGICLATAACLPPATPLLLPSLGAVAGGAGLGTAAALKMGGAGIVILGTAFPIPVITILAAGGALIGGGGAWLGQLALAGPTLLATGFYTLGTTLLIGAAIWSAYLIWRNCGTIRLHLCTGN